MNYDACIKKSIEYIENNLNKKIQLKELADKAFLSKYHFHRVFHSVVGEPVAEYIRKKRLEEAANELLTTENKIIDIALKYQFSNQESFTRAFKKLYGIPPKEFRKNKINLTTIHSRKNSTTYLSMVA
ncbi:helix-turn-helix transcriptional regulator [Clostridium beijerinckii]|uniref:Helix-turn-helix transcriptional regulator n=4 Tax=Clostridium TaxID=1485 RepID=A0AB74VD53_CLOBE|nr:AraC family transcriptional regulator [Clostridium beijerinckii]NMF05885.1 helix-turn-helix transcriptional regulator [Clostridium beijerinckii]NRZ28521.1 AraC family transcriptional regulator [Clostridium beijerinckii]NYB95702.1 AraC family transcriptional regulator [Clostridium beijerinckii]OOM25300.1 transposon Tn10 TetD protein [Clostridium beijerinckii]QUN34224.1 helix-turn-helix transcriptional regulator [Clostridium beijerinckii]